MERDTLMLLFEKVFFAINIPLLHCHFTAPVLYLCDKIYTILYTDGVSCLEGEKKIVLVRIVFVSSPFIYVVMYECTIVF